MPTTRNRFRVLPQLGLFVPYAVGDSLTGKATGHDFNELTEAALASDRLNSYHRPNRSRNHDHPHSRNPG